MQKEQSRLIYSPSDLTKFMESPFASWMDRLYKEHPDRVTPDEDSAEMKLVAEAGNKHEHVVLGNGMVESFRVEDFCHYYRQLKAGFLELMKHFDADQPPPAPDPRADHGRWQSYADKILTDCDHLAQVAGINVSQIKKLSAAGITTVATLAKAGGKPVPKLAAAVLNRLVEQADLQVQTREQCAKAKVGDLIRPVFKVLKPDQDSPRRGLELLPPHSPLDVYFDMEGFPLVEGGLEYLFGALTHDNGKPTFQDWWAHDRAEEKSAFEGFIDWAHARWKQDPAMHIYHYASYEVSAMKRLRLMERHGTREQEVDDLLRHGVFVDLYQLVRQGLRVGAPNYSLKSIELLYRDKRAGDVKTAGQSMIYYANWMASGQPRDWRQSGLLRMIRDYNEDDCLSTLQLVQWLRGLQAQRDIKFQPPAQAKPDEKKRSDKAIEAERRLKELIAAAAAKVSGQPANSEQVRITELLVHLTQFHRREAKPAWWRLFDWRDKDSDEAQDDLNSLENLALNGEQPVQVKQSLVYTYLFDPAQDTKICAGDRVVLAELTLPEAEVSEIDGGQGILKLKISKQQLNARLGGIMPRSTAIFLHKLVSPAPIDSSIWEVANAWVKAGVLPAALRRFLLRLPPELPGMNTSDSLVLSGETAADAAVRVVASMQNSALCIQGPPGTGKTTTAARMIARLLQSGKRVGVTSNSHKAIQNLLRKTNAMLSGGLKGVCAPKGGEDAQADNAALKKDCPGLVLARNSEEAAQIYTAGLIAGTAWLFAREDMKERLDYLFVDEAGQVSLANLAGMSRCAMNLVLMGDQMQLKQPIQGTHPGESGQSALNYYLQDHATIPDTLGIFLGVSYRMNPAICRFISDMAYEGRLQAAPENQAQRLALPADGAKLVRQDCGIVFSPTEHDGNTQGSDEEVARIAEIVTELLGRSLTDRDGKTRRLTLLDILFVAPYNMQVRKLQERFPDARVGAVDKFQGQEAPVVIISMCSSAGEFGSRGLEFLLDKNRVNVAISRAQTVAIVVGDPRIATTAASTVEQMEKLNLFCKLVREASGMSVRGR